MKKRGFFRAGFSELLAEKVSSIEEASKSFKKNLNHEKTDEVILYNLINRRETLVDLVEAIDSDDKNLITLKGFQGTGKTGLLKSVKSGFEENVLFFYYQCSIITNLDDIILSLYSFMVNSFVKGELSPRFAKVSRDKPIDEKLITILNNTKTPILIVIDNFENIVEEDLTIVDNEIFKFFSFLLSLDNIKLVLSGRKLPVRLTFSDSTRIHNVKILGLEEEPSVYILKNGGIKGSDQLMFQVFQASRGYPESLKLFITAVKVLNTSAFDLLKDFSGFKEPFEEYLAKKIYAYMPKNFRKITRFFAAVRHPLKISALEQTELFENNADVLQYLSSRMILTFEDNYYYMKDFFKKIVYAAMLDNEKINIHKYLNELYIREESKKLSERIIPISRRLLHSEQYYHYITLKRLQKEYDILEFKGAGLSAQKVKPADAVIDYLKVKNKPDAPPPEPKRERIIPDNELDILLTEEEKKLLNESVAEETNASESSEIDEIFENPLLKEKILESEVNDAFNKALLYEQEKKYDMALNSYKKAYELSQKTNDKGFIAKISNSIGGILNNVNKYDESLKYYENSLNIYKDINDKKSASVIYSKIANIYKETFKHESALQCYQKILAMPEENLEEKLKLEVFSGIAEIYSYREDFENALKYYLEAYEKVRMSDDNKTKSLILFKIALIYDDLNHSDNALEYYNRSIEKGLKERPTSHLASSYVNSASIYEDKKDKTKATEYYLKSLEIDGELKNYEDKAQTLSRLASMAYADGDGQKALEYYKQELECAKTSLNPYTQATAYLDLGDFYLSENNFEKAVKTYFSARKSLGKEVSTDSKEKIDRRLRMILNRIGREQFNAIMENLRRKG